MFVFFSSENIYIFEVTITVFLVNICQKSNPPLIMKLIKHHHLCKGMDFRCLSKDPEQKHRKGTDYFKFFVKIYFSLLTVYRA